MRDYVQKLYLNNFSDGKGPLETVYTSPFIDPDTDEPKIVEGTEAMTIMSSLHMVLKTLEWVLEESDAVRELKTEEEKKHYEGKIMYDGKGREFIPDTSAETFIAGIEGEW